MSQKLLYLLVALFLAINVLPTVAAKLKKNIDLYQLLNAKIEKEENFFKNNSTITQSLETIQSQQVQNKTFVWPQETADSVVFSTVQEEIKKLCKDFNGITEFINWGEPFLLKDGNFKVLPLKLRLRLSPENFGNFLNIFLNSEKLYKIEALSIIKDQKQKVLVIDMQLQGYKTNE